MPPIPIPPRVRGSRSARESSSGTEAASGLSGPPPGEPASGSQSQIKRRSAKNTSWFARHAAKVDLVAAASSASSRLRWGSPQAVLDVGEDHATMARAFAYLFGAGATLVLATLPLVDGAERFLPGLVGPALLAYAVVLLMVVRFDRLPSRLFH